MNTRKYNLFFTKSSITVKLLILLNIILPSCSEDDPNLNGKDQYVTFTVSTPYTSVPTYAMNEVAENTVRTIDILAFRVEGGQELYTYRASGTEIKDGSANTNKEFKVSLRKGEEIDYRFVVIANAADELDALTVTQNAVKHQLLGRLMSRNDGAWNAKSSTDFTPIPMWGETKAAMRITDEVQSITDITLLRSVVAVDVKILSSARSDFRLKEVYLYNRKTRGRIVPIADHFNAQETKVFEASMPLDNPANPLTIWDGLAFETASETEFTKSIYTYESAAPLANEDAKATCLVVGGLYDSEMYYYRLDFFNKDESGVFTGYKDLLRNHKYTLNVTNVTDAGYNTPDEAFYGKKGAIKAEVVEWNLTEIPVEVEDSYTLKLSATVLNVPKDANVANVIVTCDYPDGWSLPKTNPASWLRVEKQGTGILISIDLNATGSSRETAIPVKAGNITNNIKVIQAGS